MHLATPLDLTDGLQGTFVVFFRFFNFCTQNQEGNMSAMCRPKAAMQSNV